jgi:SRSO17 transposase
MPDLEAVEDWAGELRVLGSRIGTRFERAEPRQRALAYLKGLMSDVPRKNGWQLAEQAGELTPDGMQRLLSTAVWDVEGVRDDLRAYVVEHLGHPEGVLVIDESGFIKKGDKSVGVKRQYSGTAGKVENCQIGVFVGYASEAGHALIDRALYLPEEWASDPARRAEAKVPEEVTFATKPELARQMLERAFTAGVPCRWVTGDSVYGGDGRLRLWLEEHRHWFVLGVAKDEPLWGGFEQHRADAWAAAWPDDGWQRLSCGEGAKGPRLYDWALIPLPRWGQAPDTMHALLVRRSLTDEEMAYFVVFAPAGTPLQALIRVAGMRWTIEECFETGKEEVGLDDYEVRHWPGWYRHITLSMLALAFLTVTRQQAVQAESSKKQAASVGLPDPADSGRNSALAISAGLESASTRRVYSRLVRLAATPPGSR